MSDPVPEDTFVSELKVLINRHSKENGSDTPDFLLADYLNACLNTWGYFTRYRDSWYGREGSQIGRDVESTP